MSRAESLRHGPPKHKLTVIFQDKVEGNGLILAHCESAGDEFDLIWPNVNEYDWYSQLVNNIELHMSNYFMYKFYFFDKTNSPKPEMRQVMYAFFCNIIIANQ